MPEPDWGALCRDPNFTLFFESDSVSNLIHESVKVCCEAGSPYDAVQFHRGRLEAIQKLQHLPELQVKRATIREGGSTGNEGESPRQRWRERLAHQLWRAWQRTAGQSPPVGDPHGSAR